MREELLAVSQELTVPPTHAQIVNLQAEMTPLACEPPQAEHHFLPGLYLRYFKMPAGMLCVGKTHKHKHPLMVLSGRAVIVDTTGRTEVSKGYCVASLPGVKRVVLALEDTTFVTIHQNEDDAQDLVAIEAAHIDAQADALTHEADERIAACPG